VRRCLVGVTVGCALALLSACSGDSDDSAGTTTETTESAETTESTETTDTTDTTDTTGTTGTTETTDSSETTDTGGEGFVLEGDGYVVTFPGADAPEEQQSEVPLPDGSTVPITFYSQNVGNRSFNSAVASFEQAPPDVTGSLEGARDEALRTAGDGATLRESEMVDLDGIPGIRWSADVTSNGAEGSIVATIYQDGPRQYQGIVVGPGTFDAADPDVAAFLDSFEITS